jgi:hypothetical protein
MNIRSSRKLGPLVVALASVLYASGAFSSPPADWSGIPTRTVKLFYPGESTYDWLKSPNHKRAFRKVMEGDSCVSCHEGEEVDLGGVTVSGERLEPAPIKGKNATIDLNVQVAYDDRNIYWRFQWNTNLDRPGQMHNYMRFDGEKWAFYGGPRSSSKVREGSVPPLYEDRLSIMLDDGSVPRYEQQGCWLTCHNGMRDTPEEASKDEVTAHPLLGKALKKSDIRKYLPGSRTGDEAKWDRTKSAEEIAAIKKSGGFLDLMQWRAHRSNPVAMADDGYVLEYRHFDDGKNPFSWNVDRKTMTPKYMFDAAKVGQKSLTVSQIGGDAMPPAIIREENAVPYDAGAGWKADDVLPGRLLSRADAKGSAADNNQVNGTWKNGTWTLTWARPLDTGHPEDDKILKAGDVYTVSFAIHDDNVTTRYHHVSFPMSLGIGAKAALEATRVP